MSGKEDEKGAIEHIEYTGQLPSDDGHDGMTLEERAEALREAQKLDPGMPSWSWRSFKFVMSIMVVCMCSGDNGKWTAMNNTDGRFRWDHHVFGQQYDSIQRVLRSRPC